MDKKLNDMLRKVQALLDRAEHPNTCCVSAISRSKGVSEPSPRTAMSASRARLIRQAVASTTTRMMGRARHGSHEDGHGVPVVRRGHRWVGVEQL